MAETHLVSDLTLNAIPDDTKKCIEIMRHEEWLKTDSWYLAGGTALALQFGQRESYDLDFFSQAADIDTQRIVNHVSRIGNWITTARDKGTLYGELNNVKMSFISYPQCKPSTSFIQYDNLLIVRASDIAVMKIMAVSQRGRKRDFYDLYWYTKNKQSLEDVLKRVPVVYSEQQHNFHHFLKSMLYFEDAEGDSDPVIYFDASWEDVKKHFEVIVPSIAQKILGIA